jgi:hypothetical protein
MVLLTCPHCQSPVNLPDNPWGRNFACNWCRRVFTVPRPAAPRPTPAPGFLGGLSRGQVVCLLSAALVAATLGVALFVRPTGPRPPPDRKKLADELRQATAAQVREKLGPPDEVRELAAADERGNTLWIYRTRNENGKPDPALLILFKGGRVSQVLYQSPRELPRVFPD